MRKHPLRILCPNRHLGFMPAEEHSFCEGAAGRPDYYCCNSGNIPNDPAALGMDTSLSLYQWQKHDLELMLLASRQQGVPMIVGSAGDTGADSRVDLYVNLIQRLARQHNLPPFKLAYFYSEVPKRTLRALLEKGVSFDATHKQQTLSIETLEGTERILAVADVQPFMKALESGADVIIGGRSDPASVFASAAMHAGVPKHAAYSLALMLNTASRCTETLMPNETIVGTIHSNTGEIHLTRPRNHHAAMSLVVRVQQDYALPEQSLNIPLEGIGKVGERFMAMLEVRDSGLIHHMDEMVEWAQDCIAINFSERPYQLSFNMYERGLIRSEFDRSNTTGSTENRGLMVEGIAETEQLAEELTVMGSRHLVSAPQYEQHKSVEGPGIVMGELFPAPPVYRWTIHHSVQWDVPEELFTLHEFVVE